MWEMDQPWEGFDNVILASPVLKTRRMSDNGTDSATDGQTTTDSTDYSYDSY